MERKPYDPKLTPTLTQLLNHWDEVLSEEEVLSSLETVLEELKFVKAWAPDWKSTEPVDYLIAALVGCGYDIHPPMLPVVILDFHRELFNTVCTNFRAAHPFAPFHPRLLK